MSKNKKRYKQAKKDLHSFDDSDISYQSAPEYLKHLKSNGHSARTIPRAQSASDISRNGVIGNPKYKAQEDYFDEIHLLKKELKYTKDDNNNLRAKIRRLEEDNARRRKEIDNLYDTNKDGDLRRTLTGSSSPNGNVVMNLKQRVFKLELQLKQRETTIDEMKNDPRWTKSTELEIQNRALFNEIEKQKIERSNFIQHDYKASINEQTKNTVRKLEAEKRELKIENESLKKKIKDDGGTSDKDLLQKIDDLNELCRNYEHELDKMSDEFKEMKRERNKYRDKYDNINEDHEIKRERDRQKTRWNSKSPEERTKKDSKPTTPIRKSTEHIGSRSSLNRYDRHTPSPPVAKRSFRNLRRDGWNSDDEKRVKRFREKHAATVIQRGWRKHNKSHRIRHENLRNSTINRMKSSEIHSPRTSQQKLGLKIDNLGSGSLKHRPTSANMSTESALKIVQASLRGCLTRNDMDKTSRTQKLHRIDGDEEDISDRKRDSRQQHFGDRYDKIGSHNRDSPTRLHRPSSPPHDNYGSGSPRIGSGGGSKQNLSHDRNKFGSDHRYQINDRESPSRPNRSSSPPSRFDNSKQTLSNRQSSPLHDYRKSPENSLTRNSHNSRQSFKKLPTDEDFF